MSRYHHNKVTHELEPIAGYGSRVATSVDGKTLTVHSSILNIDGYNYGEGDISTAVQMIAPIESSLVASKAYAKGDQFVYNGLLYQVTVAIASGGTIIINGNCKLADSVTKQLISLDSTLNDYCKVVLASGSITIGAGSQNNATLSFTCPSGYKAILASPYSAMSWAWCWCECVLQSNNTVRVVIKNTNTIQETQTVHAYVLCIRV